MKIIDHKLATTGHTTKRIHFGVYVKWHTQKVTFIRNKELEYERYKDGQAECKRYEIIK